MLVGDFDAISLEAIARLVEIRAPESRSIECRAQLYGRTDADARKPRPTYVL